MSNSNKVGQAAYARNESNDLACIDYEALPYEGFSGMRSYDTLGYPRVFADILTPEFLRNYPELTGKFRVDYSSVSSTALSDKQHQICSLALRILCRGYITPNSKYVEESINKLISTEYTREGICDKLQSDLYCKSDGYSYDSSLEKLFAKNVLSQVFGEFWSIYTDTQVLRSRRSLFRKL